MQLKLTDRWRLEWEARTRLAYYFILVRQLTEVIIPAISQVPTAAQIIASFI